MTASLVSQIGFWSVMNMYICIYSLVCVYPSMEVGKIREEKKITGSKFAQNGMKYVMFGRLLFIHDNHVQARMIICK